jgi:hypothetical protein
MIFHLSLRQAEGFVASLVKLMGVGLTAPDHTTSCRCNKTLEVPALTRDHRGPIHLIADSTGLKIFGDGEWHARKHKSGLARRGWRKLHIGVGAEGFVVAVKLTDSSGDDASMIPDLLVQLNASIERFTGDGAFDRREVYQQVAEAGTEDVMVVAPPRRSAIPDESAEGVWAQRNAHLERIGEVGRQAWHKEVGYRKAGASGGRLPQIQANSWWKPPGEGIRGAEEGGDDRVRGAQQDVRVGEAGGARDREVSGSGVGGGREPRRVRATTPT